MAHEDVRVGLFCNIRTDTEPKQPWQTLPGTRLYARKQLLAVLASDAEYRMYCLRVQLTSWACLLRQAPTADTAQEEGTREAASGVVQTTSPGTSLRHTLPLGSMYERMAASKAQLPGSYQAPSDASPGLLALLHAPGVSSAFQTSGAHPAFPSPAFVLTGPWSQACSAIAAPDQADPATWQLLA